MKNIWTQNEFKRNTESQYVMWSLNMSEYFQKQNEIIDKMNKTGAVFFRRGVCYEVNAHDQYTGGRKSDYAAK